MKTREIVDGMANMMEHSMWEECISRKLIPEVISSVAQSLDLLYDVIIVDYVGMLKNEEKCPIRK
jgi:hypothetical protein